MNLSPVGVPGSSARGSRSTSGKSALPSGGLPPPVHKTRAQILFAPPKLMVTKRREYRDLRLRANGGFRPINLVVLGITTLINEIAADKNRCRLFACHPRDQRPARCGVRHAIALSKASITVGDECQWRTWICDGDLQSRRGIGQCPDGEHLQNGKDWHFDQQAHG